MPLGAIPIERRVTTIVTAEVEAPILSLLMLLVHLQAERRMPLQHLARRCPGKRATRGLVGVRTRLLRAAVKTIVAASQIAVLTKPRNVQAIGLHLPRAEAIRAGRRGHPSYGRQRAVLVVAYPRGAQPGASRGRRRYALGEGYGLPLGLEVGDFELTSGEGAELEYASTKLNILGKAR